MDDIKNTALGAANTESGKTNKSEPSVSELEAKVKSAQAMGPMSLTPEPKIEENKPLDLRTEMFMLNVLRRSMSKLNVYKDTKYDILSDMISQCAGVNEE